MQVRGRIVRRAGEPSRQRITGHSFDVTQRHEIDAVRQEPQQRQPNWCRFHRYGVIQAVA